METKLTGSFWKLKRWITRGEGKVSNRNDEGGVRVIELKEEKKGMQGNKSEDFSERKRRNTEEKEQRAEETKQSKLKID